MSSHYFLVNDDHIFYPESDGKPMADNTEQFKWIVTIKENLDAMLPDAFVAGDLFWYPVGGKPPIVQAPDVMVAFGRPKGKRGSYKQWKEGDVAPQVVFEILSPTNSPSAMLAKFNFYDQYGVEEYYVYDPDTNALWGWTRFGQELREIGNINGWTSPRLGIRFELDDTLHIYKPNGEAFETFAEAIDAKEKECHRAEQERQRAEQERQRAEQERQRAESAEAEIAALREKLRAAGIDSGTP